METDGNEQQRELARATDVAIRLGALALLIGWCALIVAPFLLAIAWGCIIAIALHGPFLVLSQWLGGRRVLAATLLVLALLALIIVPGVMLTGTVVDDVQAVMGAFQEGKLKVPPPSDKVAAWPIVGERVHALWLQASQNLESVFATLGPQMKPVAGWFLSSAAQFGLGLLQFVFAIAISGALLASATTGGNVARALATRLVGERGAEFTTLAAATVRGVTRGILGVALIQALLAGAALFLAGVPAAGFWTALALVLGVVQLGVGIIMVPAAIWLFSTADLFTAAAFLAWTLLLMPLDNVLKPLLMGRGLNAPVAVIFVGAIGGFITQGIIGLFVGAVVLVLGNELLRAWIAPQAAAAPGSTEP
ncbi:MAG TPA: AI-2E family transporter [Pseudomonadales bacterium]|jgi:predicted PurR-regulated permease PerM|nr:AI-2E family transporter [Pseudomonadales bacterium]